MWAEADNVSAERCGAKHSLPHAEAAHAEPGQK